MTEPHEGPPRYFLPVCVLTPLGFVGGPAGYQEVSEDQATGRGPIIVKPQEPSE